MIMLACEYKKLHIRAALWVLVYYVQICLANALNSPMCAENRLTLLAVSVCNKQHRSCKLLRSFPEEVECLLKKHATDRAIAKYDSIIILYMQPVSMTLNSMPTT